MLKIHASFRHAAVDPLLDSSLARANLVLHLGNLALPRLQPLKVKIALASSVTTSSRLWSSSSSTGVPFSDARLA